MSAHTEKSPAVSFAGCLFGDDPEQLARERKVRREALALSVLLQMVAVAALVLVPLFFAAERIALARVLPQPPYVFVGARHAPQTTDGAGGRATGPRTHAACIICAPRSIPPTIPPADPRPRVGIAEDAIPLIGNGYSYRDGFVVLPGTDPRGPHPSDHHSSTVEPRKRIRVITIEPAMLLRRVEPIYPVLARQLGREGRVELRAIVATDGTIQSLEFAGGDPLFFQSAREAVRQWRYRATVLNGVAVEVETHIIVIYQLQH